MKYLQPVYWVYIYLPLLTVIVAIMIGYYRITGDLAVCREYYPEMGTMQCYFSSKTVRVPNGK